MIFAPLVIVTSFVLLSSVSALITIYNAELPDDFNKISAEIQNYELFEIDPNTNKTKWHLEAKSAWTDHKQTRAEIKDVNIEVFDESKLGFIMTSDAASANEKNKDLYLKGNVKVTDPDHRFTLTAGGLKFTDELDLLVDSSWALNTKEKYRISGTRGIINKTLTSIVSTGNALIRKDDLHLRAEKIMYKDKKPIIAIGEASLKLDREKSLEADKIVFSLDGNVNANGAVEVKTDKISCFANKLTIVPNLDGSPKIAILDGSPYVFHDGKNIAANRIKYDFGLNVVSAEGNVHTEFL